ncbi:MAG: hydantoinase B/oxoprolinase family protein [Myxococcota bacterium]
MAEPRWRVWIDRGGTFTDCIGQDPHTHRLHAVKILSSDDAPLTGIRTLLRLGEGDPIPPCEVRLGTTLATNALLERRGRACALLITRGFGDLLQIGDQSRPDLFALELPTPAPLPNAVVEVDARLAPDGTVLAEPDEAVLGTTLAALRRQGFDALAIVVMHAHADPSLEQRMATHARTHGFTTVVCSTDVSRTPGLLARTDTAVVDAYTTPLLHDYLAHLQTKLPGSRLRVMQSSGGLADASRFRGKDAVLSGPAGGVVACAALAQQLGLSAVIGFDMGGTSTDVCRWGGAFDRVYETHVAGVRVRTPMMSIHTVAAGGGSLCRYDGQRFTVGPHSAGATPGPLCYGHPDVTEVALTDVAVALGRIAPDRFPFPIDVERSQAGVAALAEAAGLEPLRAAEGLLDVAVESMASAIRAVTVAKGHDVREHALVVFGGAGGQYGCAVAQALGVRTLLFHPLAGALSAWGIGRAAVRWHAERDGGRAPLDDAALDRLEPALTELESQGRASLQGEDSPTRVERTVALRYAGTQTTLEMPWGDAATLRDQFERVHATTFGYARPEHRLEVVSVRVELVCEQPPPPSPIPAPARPAPPQPGRLVHDGAWIDAPRYRREALPAELHGPALILEATGTIVLEPGWRMRRGPDDVLVIEDVGTRSARALDTSRDPVTLQVMGSRFMAIAEQMGEVLRRTALSTNIRERLDFSCAVFDAHGGLVANAPHMPVHLGAMGESVAAIAAQHPTPRPGDVFATNDPAAGGSHLPDITVVTPVFVDGTVAFYVASRGHHSDVGGITPGSMPPHATSLAEEGVVFRGTTIVAAGRFDDEAVAAVLEGGPHPARRPAENVADLQAQVAANHTGALLLHALCDEVGLTVVQAHMRHVQDHAAFAVRQAIGALPFDHASYEDVTDDGHRIVVALHRHADRLRVDFTGTADCGEHNLHAPRAVTLAAVLYVLRTLVGEPIPLNKGCLEPVDLVLPQPSLLHPEPHRAVAGGNVETAQRVVDVLLAAVGRKAASQGTMNNLTFGDASFGYYETIGGGDGATPNGPGRSGVHTHMTNTRITDPETLELRFPIRLDAFALRHGSGGPGAHAGGDGLVRRFTVLRDLQVSLLSDRRVVPPFGLDGGGQGAPGACLVDAAEQPGRFSKALAAGATVEIRTPGGGGHGLQPSHEKTVESP